MTFPAPPPLHEPKTVCHHWSYYRISCARYDQMLWRAQNRCEICGQKQTAESKSRLGIDHDHRLGNTIDHVRGMLCPRCNRAMTYVDNGSRKPTPEQLRYIADAWWREWLPLDLRDEHYTPPRPRDHRNAAPLDGSPAWIRKMAVGWVFAPYPEGW